MHENGVRSDALNTPVFFGSRAFSEGCLSWDTTVIRCRVLGEKSLDSQVPEKLPKRQILCFVANYISSLLPRPL